MPQIVLSFGLNGIDVKRGFLRGSDVRYPLTVVSCVFFKAVILGRDAAYLHMNTMFGLADNSKWLLENYPALRQHMRAERDRIWDEAEGVTRREVEQLRRENSKLRDESSVTREENRVLRKAISICSEE